MTLYNTFTNDFIGNQLGDTSNVGSGSGRIHSDEDDCSQSKTSKVSVSTMRL